MNEKIKELLAGVGAGYTFNHWQLTDEQMDKFSELIVKDCIGCIDIVGKVEWPATPTYELAIESSKLKIQQHFGVKNG